MVISCLVNIVQGGGGGEGGGGGGRRKFYLGLGILENSPKTVKCVINFPTDCSPGSKKRKKHAQLSDLCPALHSSVGTRLEFQGLTELECQLSNKHSCLQEKTCHFFRPHKQIKLVKENLSRETRQGESFLVWTTLCVIRKRRTKSSRRFASSVLHSLRLAFTGSGF